MFKKKLKILCFADLHRIESDVLAIKEQDAWIKQLLANTNPDVIVIAGDTFESDDCKNPYQYLHELFDGICVILTLGNHEFYGHTVPEVLKEYEDLYDPSRWNVHCLDIVHAYDIGKVHFFGNVLWYDGSMGTVPNQYIADFANRRWEDFKILGFNWENECNKCFQNIKANQPTEKQIGFLVTHCIPNKELNAHLKFEHHNEYNVFSGVSWLLDEIRTDYAICGHTHRSVNTIINGIHCINIGNGHHPPFHSCFLEIE